MEYLKVAQVAKHFGITRQAVHYWIDSGVLPAIKLPIKKRHKVMITQEDFEFFLKKMKR